MMLLQIARDNMRNIRKTYADALEPIWAGNVVELNRILDESTSAEEAIAAVGRTFMYGINTALDNAPVVDLAVNWLLREQLLRGIFANELGFRESPYVSAGEHTPNFLRTVSMATNIVRGVPDLLTVLELGAGAGHLARILMLMQPNISYTIIDLPETLAISFMHLTLCFPEKRIVYATCAEDFDADFDILFVPTMLAHELRGRKYDLFVNTASLGEMHNDVIAHWMRFVQRGVKVKYLFTLNRFLNTITADHAWRLDCNQCSLCYDADWDILGWEVEPSYTRCPYIDTLHSRYVEIIARRRELTVDAPARSFMLFEDVSIQDWARLPSDPTMTMRDNILAPDLTMGGPLFKLWESIRLCPTRQAAELMVRLMGQLCHSPGQKCFEEMSWYTRLAVNP